MKDILIVLTIAIMLTACGLPSVKEVRYITDTFEPTEQVEVLYTWPHDRKYIAISKLEVRAGDYAEEALTAKAKEIGADAIVMGPIQRHGRVEVPIDGNGKTTCRVTLDCVPAIAIKYRP